MKYGRSIRLGAALLAAAVGGLAGHGTARAQLPSPIADYQFQNTLASTGGTLGPLTEVSGGTYAYSPDTVKGQTQQVLNISGGGVQTPINPFADPAEGTYSIVMECSITLSATNATPGKIFDFKNLSTDAGLYIVQSTGFLQFIDNSGVVIPGATGLTPVLTGTYFQLTLTRTAGGVVTGYQNGTQAFQFDDSSSQLATLNTMLTIFKDDSAGTGLVAENTPGNLAELRLYNAVLTPTQVGLLANAPEPGTWVTMLVGAGTGLGLTMRRRRRRVAA